MKMKGTWQIVGLAIICLLGLFFIARLVQQRRAGNCVLHARVAVVGRDAPIAQALHSSSDVLSLRNADGADWTDVEVTISGFETTATTGTQPTGAYRLTKNVGPAGKSTSFNVNDFREGAWPTLGVADDEGCPGRVEGDGERQGLRRRDESERFRVATARAVSE